MANCGKKNISQKDLAGFTQLNNRKADLTGFTLIEALVYIGIVGFVISGFITFGLLIAVNNSKFIAMEEVQANTQIALNYISRMVRQADAIVSPGPGSASGSLELSFSGGPNIIFAAINGVLYANSDRLTSGRVNISNLSFTDLAPNNRENNIIINLSAQANGAAIAGANYSQNLRTAVTLRR